MISLTKNKAISLTKETGGATLFEARVKWDINSMTNQSADVDIMAIGCGANKKCLTPNEKYFVYNTNPEPLKMIGDSVMHSGDSRDGASEGWDEILTVDFAKMPSDVDTLTVMLNIYDETLSTTFGQVTNLTVEIFDVANQKVVAEYLPELENDSDKVFVIGEFMNKTSSAFFKAIGEGSPVGAPVALEAYGIVAKY